MNSGTHDYYVYSDQTNLLIDQGWKHVTFVFRNQDGLRKIYIDGEDKTGTGPNIDSTPSGLLTTWRIGYLSNGEIDEVQIWDRALSEEEVKQLYWESKP